MNAAEFLVNINEASLTNAPENTNVEAEELLIKRQKRELIDKYSSHSFKLFCMWLAAILAIVTLDGFNFLGFSIKQAVMIALLSTTTVNIIGLLALVFGYIFYIQDA